MNADLQQVANDAGLVICASDAEAQRRIVDGADAARVVVIPPAVDRSVFSPEGPLASGPEGKPKLLALEAHPRLLEACAMTRHRLPGLKLAVADQAQGLPDFAVAVGNLSDAETAKWLRWADALLAPVAQEEVLLPLAQALACGTPCITGQGHVVTDHWDGLLTNPADSAEIADAIGRIAEPGLRARLAAPARTSSERFDSGKVQAREQALLQCLRSNRWPLMSVVLPTFNRERLVEAAVRNVLSQDYPNLELIVVNDGSPDGTQDVLDNLAATLKDPRLKLMKRENGGLPRALNTGFTQAHGEYWTWTSDDNAYRPGALRALALELQINPDAGLVCADMLIRNEHGRERRFAAGPPEKLDDTSVVGGCFMYRASVAKVVGEYDPHFALVEDYDYWLRMRKQTSIVWLPRILYDYADEPEGLTRKRIVGVNEKRLELLRREHGAKPDWPRMLLNELCSYSVLCKRGGLPAKALAVAWRAVRHLPGAWAGWRAMLRAMTPRVILNLMRKVRGLDAG